MTDDLTTLTLDDMVNGWCWHAATAAYLACTLPKGHDGVHAWDLERWRHYEALRDEARAKEATSG